MNLGRMFLTDRLFCAFNFQKMNKYDKPSYHPSDEVKPHPVTVVIVILMLVVMSAGISYWALKRMDNKPKILSHER
jgi:hypothetical protein